MPRQIPPLTRKQVRTVDEIAVSQFGMNSLVLMENAGAAAARLLMQQNPAAPIVVCSGKGNNGGDGLVVARHLLWEGYEVHTFLCDEPAATLSADAAANLNVLEKAGIPLHYSANDFDFFAQAVASASWIVDGLLGTGAVGEIREPLRACLAEMNKSPGKRFALDLPSGLDCDTGTAAAGTLVADITCTFVAEKIGFAVPAAKPYLGEVFVAPIGIPPRVIKAVLSQ